jgi:hypothetical protein
LIQKTLPLADAGGWVKFLQQAAANRPPVDNKKCVYGNFAGVLMATKKRSDKNSTTSIVAGFAGAMADIPLPAGVELRSDEEQVLWDQFTRARAKEDWRDLDLILLSKVVRMEADIRAHQQTLDRSGVIIQNKRGTLVTNPLLAVIDTLERRQLAVIRSMSLNQQHADPRTINASAKAQDSARNVIKDVGIEGLIAMPLN